MVGTPDLARDDASVGSSHDVSGPAPRTYEDFSDQQIKHLELIQAVITRLGGNGFLVKGWALTVAGVFFGFALEADNWMLAAASVPITVLFWLLDAYFLRAERLFRELYRRVTVFDATVTPFFMGATGDSFVELTKDCVDDYWATVLTPVVWRLYAGIAIGAAAVGIAVVTTGAACS